MKILLDYCVPRPIKSLLAGHEVATAFERGWASLKNGELLTAAETAGFEVLLTVDKNLHPQQNLTGRTVRLVVAEADTNRVADIAPLLPQVMALLPTLAPGQVVRVQKPDQEASENS